MIHRLTCDPSCMPRARASSRFISCSGGDAEEVVQIRAGSTRLRARRKLQSLVARTDTQRKKHHRRPPVVTFARPSRDWGKGGREGGQRTGDEEGDSPLLLQLVELVGA